jgi:hypothetical protein
MEAKKFYQVQAQSNTPPFSCWSILYKAKFVLCEQFCDNRFTMVLLCITNGTAVRH